MNNRQALGMHMSISIALLGISIHDCILVPPEKSQQTHTLEMCCRVRVRAIMHTLEGARSFDYQILQKLTRVSDGVP
jgi:hypothetical protein